MQRALALLVVPLIVWTSATQTADAQRRRQRQPRQDDSAETTPAPTLADLASITPRLESANPDEVREAIDLLSIIDHPDVIPHLAQLLRAGQPDPITDRALEALRGLEHPSSIEVLTEFTNHRRSGARRRAYLALAAIDSPQTPALIETGLRDSDRSVRAACALALGNIGARGSLETLFRAFERGVVEAAISIGKLGDRQSLGRFAEHLGRAPLAVMLSGYEQFLGREDVSIEVKTEIVAALAEVSSPQVRTFLQDYLGTFPERDRNRARVTLRETVEETIRRIRPEGG